MADKYAVELKNISIVSGKETIITGLSFNASKGEVCTLCLPSDKVNAVFNLIYGTVDNTDGELFINGTNVTKHPIDFRHIGLVSKPVNLGSDIKKSLYELIPIKCSVPNVLKAKLSSLKAKLVTCTENDKKSRLKVEIKKCTEKIEMTKRSQQKSISSAELLLKTPEISANAEYSSMLNNTLLRLRLEYFMFNGIKPPKSFSVERADDVFNLLSDIELPDEPFVGFAYAIAAEQLLCPHAILVNLTEYDSDTFDAVYKFSAEFATKADVAVIIGRNQSSECM